MKSLLLLLLAFITFSFGSEQKGIFLIYSLEKSILDKTLDKNQSVFKFTFTGFNDSTKNRAIVYSLDGKQDTVDLINDEYFEITTYPGVHKFQFYYDRYHYEVSIDSLSIKAQYRDDYKIYLEDSRFPVVVDKPVIYLYPESAMEVEVKLDIHGKESFTYPLYDGGWNFSASPDGTLSFGDDKYNYLFWESEQNVSVTPRELKSGFVVSKAKTIEFLEAKLTEAGLNSKEQADFITYWGPRLIQNETNYIHFEFNEECNKYAELNITPKPDNIYRIYMIWAPLKPHYKVTPQIIVPMSREGFTVIEWGGTEITTDLFTQLNN